MKFTTNHGTIDFGPSNGVRENGHGSESAGGAVPPRAHRVPIAPRIERTDDSDRSIWKPLAERIANANA